MRKLVFAGFFLYMAQPVLAAASSGFAVAVDAILSHNSGIKAAEAKIRQAEAGRREAQAMRLPMLSARSQFTRGDQPVYVFGSLMEQGRFGPQNFAIDALNHPGDLSNIQSGLDLGVPLFTGFELASAARLSELAEAQAKRATLDSGVHYASAIASLSIALGTDASKFDPDAPLPPIPTSLDVG